MSQETLNNVIFVDDEPDMRMLVQAVLQNSGIRVRTCETGAEMIETALAEPPQMILLDVMMDWMDGPSVVQEIRSQPGLAQVPIVFMTGKTDPAALEDLKSVGVAGIINKPFNIIELKSQIETLWKNAA